MKRQKAKIEALKKEEEEEKERVRAAARERVLRDFEKGQVGIFASGTRDTQGASEKKDNDDSSKSHTLLDPMRPPDRMAKTKVEA